MVNKSMRGAVIGAAVGVASALATSPALADHPSDDGITSPELVEIGRLDLELLGANVTDVWATETTPTWARSTKGSVRST